MEDIDLNYDPTTFAGPVDPRVIEFLETYRGHKFDVSYLDHARKYHGGIPGKQYFDAADGKTYRVGRFLTLIDDKSHLRPPFRPSWEFPDRDIRIDWSVLTLIDEEGPACRNLFGGEKLLPFAALYRGGHHPDSMGSQEADCVPDLVCFFYESGAASSKIVVWLALRALDEYFRMEEHWREGIVLAIALITSDTKTSPYLVLQLLMIFFHCCEQSLESKNLNSEPFT